MPLELITCSKTCHLRILPQTLSPRYNTTTIIAATAGSLTNQHPPLSTLR